MTSPQAWLGPNVPACCRGCHHSCRGLTGTPLSCCPDACPVPTAVQVHIASLLAFRAGPVLLGDNHRSEGTLGFAQRGKRVHAPRWAPPPAVHGGPWADVPLHASQLRCPSTGRFLGSLLGPFPSQQQPQCLTTKAPARQSPELPIPVRAMSHREPRYRTARPAGGQASRGQVRTFHCLPRRQPALLISFSL